MQLLKRSRKRPKSGDIFTLRMTKVGYLFGRVVYAGISESHPLTSEAYMLYIYDIVSSNKGVDVSALPPDRLLIPPFFINRLPWIRGYFETLGNFPLTKSDMVKVHCFYDIPFDRYVDENGDNLPRRTDPCGMFGVMSYGFLDDALSDALGIERAPGD
ncbi:immunity 26/phosphotriesterase HocA family protein [Sphaerimonospora mesophila]|uniref:immunity 26/phosphotriesterase HocA family protein n=1 Tax=Sphaerimonospora mesophila TaxID=37483 RepID=UPI001F2F9DFD